MACALHDIAYKQQQADINNFKQNNFCDRKKLVHENIFIHKNNASIS